MNESAAVASVGAFAVDLTKRVAGSGGNVFFSPHSIAAALAMVRAGARGETAREIDAVLHLPPDAPAKFRELTAALVTMPKIRERKGNRPIEVLPAYTLSIANGLFAQRGWPFKDPFRSTIGSDYGAELREVDFQRDRDGARAEINGWVEEKTAHRIEAIVPPDSLSPETRMVLANAIHYKAEWLEPFHEKATRDAPFTIAAGRKVTVKRMRLTSDYFHHETPEAQIVKIPYSFATSMLVVLPKAEDGLDDLVRGLTVEALSSWTSGTGTRHVALELPKFSFTTALTLSDVLQEMGIRDAFSAERADLSAISDEKPLFIDGVLHKAFVAVDEKGTEAAAATAVRIDGASLGEPEKPLPFIVDHPFLFFIYQRQTGAILFVGRVTDPTRS